MEGEWDNEISNGPVVPVRIETQVWESSSSHRSRNNDFPRSRGRGSWNQSDSVENLRKPGGQVSESYNRSGRGSKGRGFGSDQRTSRNGYGRPEDDGSGDSQVISVPSNKVGRIIGKGGSKIRELQDDSGAKIDVERDSRGESTTVEISGTPDAVNKATQLINDLVNEGDDRSSRSFGGSTFGGGRSESNRGFGRSQYGDSSESINVPSSNVGMIIGRGGSKIRELQDESGAYIKVERDSPGETTSVEISGSPDAVNKAIQLINDLVNEGDDRSSRSFGGSTFGGGRSESNRGFGRSQYGDSSKTINVPSSNVGMIIGRGGSKIRELQDESGAYIKVERDSQGETTTVEISGSPDAINKATQLINDLVNEGDDRSSRSFGGGSASNDFNESRSTFGGGRNESNRGFGRSQHGDSSESINVPSSNVGMIIGKGGSRIRELQDESGAHIKVQRDSDPYGETVVEISGSSEAVSKAKDLINEIVNDSGDRGSRSFGGSSRSYGGDME